MRKFWGALLGLLSLLSLVMASPAKAETLSCDQSISQAGTQTLDLPQSIAPIAGKTLTNEGVWSDTKLARQGVPVMKMTKVRFDALHATDYATLVWLDSSKVSFQQVPGTQVPKKGIGSGRIASGLKPCYIAGFTGGYLMKDSRGGAIYGTTVVSPMIKGKGTLVTYSDGTLDIVKWPNIDRSKLVAQARQNLDLLVENGLSKVPKPEVHNSWGWVWNGTGVNKNDVQRTGVGIRHDGSIVWAMGRKLNATNLAKLLIRAGAIRALALDMNMGYANAYMYGPYHTASRPGKPFDARMTGSSNRFWGAAQRDFVAVFVRP